MTTWILIFTIYYGRNPAVASFYDKAACENAIHEIEKSKLAEFRDLSFAICVPASRTGGGK